MKLVFTEHIANLILSSFQALFIQTTEENRLAVELAKALEIIDKSPPYPTFSSMQLISWDCHRGFNPAPPNGKNILDPVAALDSLPGTERSSGQAISKVWGNTNGIFVFHGLHDFLKDAVVRQALRNLVTFNSLNAPFAPSADGSQQIRGYRRPIILVAPVKTIHQDVAHCLTIVPFELPDTQQLESIFEYITSEITNKPDDKLRERTISAMRGLREREAEDILSLSLRVNKGFNLPNTINNNPGIAELVEDEKASKLQKSEVLHYISADRIANEDSIGGNDLLKIWIKRKAVALGPLGRKFKLDPPRGAALLGAPGVGKSTISKIFAKELCLPLVVFNVARLGGSLVGESQQRTEEALKQIDSFDGAVIMIDEADKIFGGTGVKSGDGGNESSKQVFGMINTWLTEHTSRSFVVLTLNRINGVPEEFLRKGRLDEVWFIDLPTPRVRRKILEIHLKKREAYDPTIDLQTVVEMTNDFSGAELEQIVIDAREVAVLERQFGVPNLNEMVTIAGEIKPLAQTRADDIAAMREIAMANGKFASSPDVEDVSRNGKMKRRVQL